MNENPRISMSILRNLEDLSVHEFPYVGDILSNRDYSVEEAEEIGTGLLAYLGEQSKGLFPIPLMPSEEESSAIEQRLYDVAALHLLIGETYRRAGLLDTAQEHFKEFSEVQEKAEFQTRWNYVPNHQTGW